MAERFESGEEPEAGASAAHKPARDRRFRGFAKEYLIIVIGVLTALAAQQAADWLHRRNEVTDARAALHDEVQRNLTKLSTEAREDRCMQPMLDRFDAWARGGAKPAYPGDDLGSLRTSVWDIAKVGAVADMPLDERLALSKFYGAIDNQSHIIQGVRERMAELRGFLNLPVLSPAQAEALLKAAGGTRTLFTGEAENIPGLLKLGSDLGVSPGRSRPEFVTRVDALCRAAGVAGE